MTPLAYTVPQVAEALQVSERTVRTLISDGTLPHFRVGRLVRISSEILTEFIRGDGPALHGTIAHWPELSAAIPDVEKPPGGSGDK